MTRRLHSACRLAVGGLMVAAVAVTAACGTDDDTTGDDESTGDETAAEAAVEIGEADLELRDGWVRAEDGEMTAVFGTLVNSGDEDVTLVSASSPASQTMELHEVVDQGGENIMQEKEGGIVVPAAGEAVLEPGADHLMLMGLTGPVQPGDEVEVTVTDDTGATATFTVAGRESAAGDEEYVGDGGHSDMDHSDGDGMDGMESDGAEDSGS